MIKVLSKITEIHFKAELITARRLFDREVQRSKRIYWYNIQNDMLKEADKNRTDFCKSIGRVGISQTEKNRIPFEVVLNDGTILSDKQDVFEK